MSPALSPEGLSPLVLYQAPSGRLCRWVPGRRGDAHRGGIHHFQYIEHGADGGSAALPDGFSFTTENLRLLVAVADDLRHPGRHRRRGVAG